MSPHIRAVHCTDAFVRDIYVRTEALAPQSIKIPVHQFGSPLGAHEIILVGPSIYLPLAITSFDMTPTSCVLEVRAMNPRGRLACGLAFSQHSPLPDLWDPLRRRRDLGELFKLALET